MHLFTAMGNQWRENMGGRTGLDHNVLFRRMDRMGLTADEYDWLDHDVRVMESAALEAMQQKT